MVEKICSGLEPMATYDELVKELGQEPYAIYAVEAGGVNSTIRSSWRPRAASPWWTAISWAARSPSCR